MLAIMALIAHSARVFQRVGLLPVEPLNARIKRESDERARLKGQRMVDTMRAFADRGPIRAKPGEP